MDLVTNFTNKQLIEELQKRGVKPGPILSSTRKIYEKKLIKLYNAESEQTCILPRKSRTKDSMGSSICPVREEEQSFQSGNKDSLFGLLNNEQIDTRLVLYNETVYKLKMLFKEDKRVSDVCSLEDATSEMEQVFRAVLYMDQRNEMLKQISTKHFYVFPKKKFWKISRKLQFTQNGNILKSCQFYFEFTVKYRETVKNATEMLDIDPTRVRDKENKIEYSHPCLYPKEIKHMQSAWVALEHCRIADIAQEPPSSSCKESVDSEGYSDVDNADKSGEKSVKQNTSTRSSSRRSGCFSSEIPSSERKQSLRKNVQHVNYASDSTDTDSEPEEIISTPKTGKKQPISVRKKQPLSRNSSECGNHTHKNSDSDHWTPNETNVTSDSSSEEIHSHIKCAKKINIIRSSTDDNLSSDESLPHTKKTSQNKGNRGGKQSRRGHNVKQPNSPTHVDNILGTSFRQLRNRKQSENLNTSKRRLRKLYNPIDEPVIALPTAENSLCLNQTLPAYTSDNSNCRSSRRRQTVAMTSHKGVEANQEKAVTSKHYQSTEGKAAHRKINHESCTEENDELNISNKGKILRGRQGKNRDSSDELPSVRRRKSTDKGNENHEKSDKEKWSTTNYGESNNEKKNSTVNLSKSVVSDRRRSAQSGDVENEDRFDKIKLKNSNESYPDSDEGMSARRKSRNKESVGKEDVPCERKLKRSVGSHKENKSSSYGTERGDTTKRWSTKASTTDTEGGDSMPQTRRSIKSNLSVTEEKDDMVDRRQLKSSFGPCTEKRNERSKRKSRNSEGSAETVETTLSPETNMIANYLASPSKTRKSVSDFKAKDRHMVEREEVEEEMKLQELATFGPSMQTLRERSLTSPRKRKGTCETREIGVWKKLDDYFITPVKKLFKATSKQ